LIKVSRVMPKPKKVLSTIPSAASSLRMVRRTMASRSIVPIQPAIPAPRRRTICSREPVNRKATQMPGSAACASVSPSNPWRRRTA
jgi:hypothetical protein